MPKAEERLMAHGEMVRLEHGDREAMEEAGVGGLGPGQSQRGFTWGTGLFLSFGQVILARIGREGSTHEGVGRARGSVQRPAAAGGHRP